MKMNKLSGYHFTLCKERLEEVTINLILVASDADYKLGYRVSYDFPQDIHSELEKIGLCELQEGHYEFGGEIEELKENLNKKGGIIHDSI